VLPGRGRKRVLPGGWFLAKPASNHLAQPTWKVRKEDLESGTPGSRFLMHSSERARSAWWRGCSCADSLPKAEFFTLLLSLVEDLSLLAIRTYVTVSSLELTKREIVMLMH
jgi:hypothetical protein